LFLRSSHVYLIYFFFFSSRRRHTRSKRDWSSDVCSSDLYNQGKYEAIDVIEDWKLNFNLGNTVKYISRAGHKDDIIQDLKKALRSEERRVGKECRYRRARDHEKKKERKRRE